MITQSKNVWKMEVDRNSTKSRLLLLKMCRVLESLGYDLEPPMFRSHGRRDILFKFTIVGESLIDFFESRFEISFRYPKIIESVKSGNPIVVKVNR